MKKRNNLQYRPLDSEEDFINAISEVMGTRYSYIAYLVRRDLHELMPDKFGAVARNESQVKKAVKKAVKKD